MLRTTRFTLVALPYLAFCAACGVYLQAHRVACGQQQVQQRARISPYGEGVYKSRVNANWFADNTRFWYRNDLPDRAKEFILVDATAGKREKAFDHQRLAAALSKADDKQYKPDRLPFETIEFVEGGVAIQFTVGEVKWICNLSNYELTHPNDKATEKASDNAKVGTDDSLNSPGFDQADLARIDSTAVASAPEAVVTESDATVLSPQSQDAGTQSSRGTGAGSAVDGVRRSADRTTTATSPDKKWTATIRDANIILRNEDSSETKLTDDGRSDFAYTHLYWSPDSASLVAFRLQPGDHKEVYRIESSPAGTDGATGGGVGRAVLHNSVYPLPGDKLDSYELNVFNVESKKQFKPLGDERIDMNADGGDPNPAFGGPFATLRWTHDGTHFRLEKYDRGHQRVRLIEVNAQTGETRNIIDEKSNTFIWTAHFEGLNFRFFNYLRDENELIYASEMDGWRHLYHVDATTGTMKPITSGSWVVRGVNRIDEDARQIWFTASGVLPDQDPYFIHYGRVNFDGSGLTWLTSGNGNHTISFGRQAGAGFRGGNRGPGAASDVSSFSPDFKYVIDTYSRVDLPPITELRRATDGQFVCLLEKAEVTADWAPPEVFVAKGRDDATDIWGIIVRPKNFDPAKKYPIIEDIYAGPQDSFVPKKFNTTPRYQDLTDLGFVVVKIDGMGTANRSKAFHDVCWKNLKDAGFADRIAWIKAAAKKYPYMDTDRVGIYGTSAGGQNAAAAVLFHPEFYKVAVANSGCHDNRMDKVSWNEQWMGYPVGPQYAECSNIDNASRLKGHLQLVVGELDTNVPPESTYRFVNALVKTKKDFEFVLIPGADHGADSPITRAKRNDFFVRYLQNGEPPNRNAPVATVSP